jgi:hypothetical protein
MNILVVYDQYSTHTNTVHEHLEALGRFSAHRHFFCHCGRSGSGIDWSSFDVLVIHYSARLISRSINVGLRRRISNFRKAKVLFVQDEYDLTELLRELIAALSIDLVFTCVPRESIETIYPAVRFPNTSFTSTLTGFVPVDPMTPDEWDDPAERSLLVGYRGRALPFWYGDLGQEKQEIAERFRRECEKRSLPCDIEWDDRHRIYGEAWPRFMANCRATLGTESGSNLFDDDGSLRRRFTEWQVAHPCGSYAAARKAVLGDVVEHPLMNQISPRIFEAIASGTALVLYEGSYSGVVQPDAHYIPLRKDFSNIDAVFAVLNDPAAIRAMTRRAYRDVIENGAWSYQTFVAEYDRQIEQLPLRASTISNTPRLSGGVTNEPTRLDNVSLPPFMASLWRALPVHLRTRIYPFARAVAMAGRRLAAGKQ